MSVINQFAVNLQDTVAFYRGRRQFKVNIYFSYGARVCIRFSVIVYDVISLFQDLLKYIRKKAPSATPQQTTRELNNFIDSIIADVVEQLRIKKCETVPINRLEDQFTKKWMGLTLKGTYRANNGQISNLSTVYRKENCVLTVVKNDGRIFSFTLALKTAKMEFERYELRFGPINTNGKISIEARDNAFNVKINIYLKKNSKIQNIEVTRAEVTKCGNFKVSLTGFGTLGGNSVAKMILKMILNTHKNEMKAVFEKDLKNYIKQTIDDFL